MDDAILAYPSKRVTVEYDAERKFWRWSRHQKMRTTFVLRALPLRSLLDLEGLLDGLIARRGSLDLVEACAVIVGPRSFELPGPALQALYDAYREVNGLSPKAQAEGETASPSAPSSDASSASPSSSPSDTSSP